MHSYTKKKKQSNILAYKRREDRERKKNEQIIVENIPTNSFRSNKTKAFIFFFFNFSFLLSKRHRVYPLTYFYILLYIAENLIQEELKHKDPCLLSFLFT